MRNHYGWVSACNKLICVSSEGKKGITQGLGMFLIIMFSVFSFLSGLKQMMINNTNPTLNFLYNNNCGEGKKI